jgi:hypothetical protein
MSAPNPSRETKDQVEMKNEIRKIKEESLGKYFLNQTGEQT